MVKEYDPTAAAPDWELEPMVQEGDTADATTLSAEEVMADVARAAGGSERPAEESTEIMALTAELKGETAPSNVGEKGSEGELEGLFDDAPVKSPEGPKSQLSKEEIDAEIDKMFADESQVEKVPPNSQNDPTLRALGETYLNEFWRTQVGRAEMTPDNIRGELDHHMKMELREKSQAIVPTLLGTAGIGINAAAITTGSALGIPALAAAGGAGLALGASTVGVPAIALGIGAYKGYKIFKAWNDKRKGFNALAKAGY